MAKIRRSIIEVPGNIEKMLAKARSFQADVLVLDLEDSVPRTPEDKATARRLIAEFLRSPEPVVAREVAVRINASDSEWFFDDVQWLAAQRLDAVMLPKVRSIREYIFIEELLDRLKLPAATSTIVIVETPGAMLELPEIARAARRLDGLVAGGFDYTIECHSTALNGMLGLGGEMVQSHLALLRQTVVAVARAQGLSAIDGPLLAQAKDNEALRAAVQAARLNGFDGCMVFYPPMLDVVHEVFAPTAAEQHWAQRIRTHHAEAVKQGRAAFQLDGKVVLPHHLIVAERILAERPNPAC